MIVSPALVALLLYLVPNTATMQEQYPDAPGWVLPLLTVLGFGNVVWAIALFNWKRWGFYGFCATTIVALVIDLWAAEGLTLSLLGGGPGGVALLYGVLHIGKERKAWPKLV